MPRQPRWPRRATSRSSTQREKLRTPRRWSGSPFRPDAEIDYVTVARLSELAPGALLLVSAGDRQYVLVNVEGQLHALDSNCPHNGGPLARGTLNGSQLTCPWHGWTWDVTSGRNCWPGADQQRAMRVPVRVVGEEIQLPVL